MSEPSDPVTPLMEGAAQCHELYVTYREAGFTAEQSLYLVGQILAAVVRGASS